MCSSRFRPEQHTNGTWWSILLCELSIEILRIPFRKISLPSINDRIMIRAYPFSVKKSPSRQKYLKTRISELRKLPDCFPSRKNRNPKLGILLEIQAMMYFPSPPSPEETNQPPPTQTNLNASYRLHQVNVMVGYNQMNAVNLNWGLSGLRVRLGMRFKVEKIGFHPIGISPDNP